MTLRTILAAVTLGFVCLVVRDAAAHDYWLQPKRFDPPPGGTLDVELVVGDALAPEQRREYQPDRTERFELVTHARTIDLRPRIEAGAEPVIEALPIDFEGASLVAMQRRWTDIVLEDAKFTDYLAHEGLDEIASLRDRIGHRKQERECYTRSVKTLVKVGDAKARGVHRRVLGHRMEIVLLDDPHRRDTGDDLRARVLFRGKPLRGALLTAHVRDAAGKVVTQRVRTNRRGVARVHLKAAGTWALRLVHMQPCAGCTHTDWESFWASYTFAVD